MTFAESPSDRRARQMAEMWRDTTLRLSTEAIARMTEPRIEDAPNAPDDEQPEPADDVITDPDSTPEELMDAAERDLGGAA